MIKRNQNKQIGSTQSKPAVTVLTPSELTQIQGGTALHVRLPPPMIITL